MCAYTRDRTGGDKAAVSPTMTTKVDASGQTMTTNNPANVHVDQPIEPPVAYTPARDQRAGSYGVRVRNITSRGRLPANGDSYTPTREIEMELQSKNGARVRRERVGLSQERLAMAAGCSTGTIRLIEGGSRCSDAMAKRIAAVLDCEAQDLFERDVTPERLFGESVKS